MRTRVAALAIVAFTGACVSCGSPGRRESESGPPPPPPRATADRPAPADKRHTLATLLALGPVLVQLDARRAGVDVPASHRSDPQLVLRIGRDLSPPIADLELGATALTATLMFGGRPYRCVVPWSAIYGASLEGEDTGTVWSADAPADLPRAPE
ncbi:MAG: hypothetical protein ACTHU0_29210 [Kofleriaceae bacterium]